MDRCEAHRVGVVAGPYGFLHEPCGATTGLRTYFDVHGQAHAFCPAVGHLDQLVRLYAPSDAHEHHTYWNAPRDCAACAEDMTTTEQIAWAQ